MLSYDQKELLRKCSSGLSGQDYSTLEPEEREALAERLENAIKLIQAVNPNAFLFRYEKGVKIDNNSDMLKRNFFHAPNGIAKYDTAKKYQILYPEQHKILSGVK